VASLRTEGAAPVRSVHSAHPAPRGSVSRLDGLANPDRREWADVARPDCPGRQLLAVSPAEVDSCIRVDCEQMSLEHPALSGSTRSRNSSEMASDDSCRWSDLRYCFFWTFLTCSGVSQIDI